VHSDETNRMVDSEIRGIISEAYAIATEILDAHRPLMELLAKELQEKETLGTDEIFSLILANISPDEAELVGAKHKKALELRFEHSDALIRADDSAAPPPDEVTAADEPETPETKES